MKERGRRASNGSELRWRSEALLCLLHGESINHGVGKEGGKEGEGEKKRMHKNGCKLFLELFFPIFQMG